MSHDLVLKDVMWKQDDNETYSQCTRYDIDWMTMRMENYSVMATYLPVPNASSSVVPCDHGWEYETSEITSSIVINVRSYYIEKLYSACRRCVVPATKFISIKLVNRSELVSKVLVHNFILIQLHTCFFYIRVKYVQDILFEEIKKIKK